MSRESRRQKARQEQIAERAAAAGAPTEAPERGRTSPAQFLREVRTELKKVNWPNRREVGSYTVVVLVTTLVLVLFTWGVDWVFSNAVINLFE